MEEPTFTGIENGWYVFNDNGDRVMIPPSLSELLREVTTARYEELTGEWVARCLAVRETKKEVKHN
jgi:hypothetical protein